MKQLFVILFLGPALSFGQTNSVELILPHLEYSNPTGCFIGNSYAVAFSEGELLTYCSFDLEKMNFVSSSGSPIENANLTFGEIGTQSYTFLQTNFAEVQQDHSPASNNANENRCEWIDRLNIITLDDTSFYQTENINTKSPAFTEVTKPISGKIFNYYKANYAKFRGLSMSPNGECIALAIGLEITVFNTVSGDKIWQSPKLKSLKSSPTFKLLDGNVVVLPENFIDEKPFEVTWYNFSTNELLYSSSEVTNGIFVGEYQGMHYYTFATGDPDKGKINQTQYINLKTGEFSQPNQAGRRQRYTLGHHVVDNVLKQEVSQKAYDRFMENYTEYPFLMAYFTEYYAFLEELEDEKNELFEYYLDQGYDLEDIVKVKLTPMTLPVYFFDDFRLPIDENKDYDEFAEGYEIQYVYEGKATVKKEASAFTEILGTTESREIVFWNSKMPDDKRTVSLVSTPKGTPILITPDNYFFSTKDVKDFLAFSVNGKRYSFEQFDLKYNRPDIVLERLGYADTNIINAYHSAYLKRLEKLGFKEDMLNDNFNLPSCKISNAKDIPTRTNQKEITLIVEAESDSSNLNRIEVWINDVAIYGSKGLSIPASSSHFTKEIKLVLQQGTNNIKVAVLNNAGASSYFEEITVNTSAGKTKPNLYLVSIGVSEYKQSGFNLTYADKDATDIASFFESDTSIYNEVKTKMYKNEQVNVDILEEIRTFLSTAERDDQVIIFVAGHGVLDDNYDYYLATNDMNFSDPKSNGIEYSAFELLLDGIKPIKKLLLIDACHGGEFDKDDIAAVKSVVSNSESGDISFRGTTATINQSTNQSAFELSKKLFVDLRKGTGATIISSSGGFEFAMEGENWNNGLFTYCLLIGLKDGHADLDQDGRILIQELHEYVSEKVFELSNGMQKPATRRTNSESNFRIW